MNDFVEKMRLKGQAEEDCYFARRDRELIEQQRRRRPLPLRRVLSGGQTGVDRAALDVALEQAARLSLEVGGWCPRGRWAEDGAIPLRYPLQETPSAEPAQRTEWNLRDSDATLVLTRGELAGGTALTVALARDRGHPLRIVDLNLEATQGPIRDWLHDASIGVLNVAGPRESESPGIGRDAAAWLRALLDGAGS
ncbi:MAG: hypothetical protein GVY22_07230 [Gammaproteobacteria bacterium]|jgi:hypothetical protein|nr:hypothetical protein [Gammaproteobacteria bacterium]